MTKEKLLFNLRKAMTNKWWSLDIELVQDSILEEVGKDIDLLLKSSCNCGGRQSTVDIEGQPAGVAVKTAKGKEILRGLLDNS